MDPPSSWSMCDFRQRVAKRAVRVTEVEEEAGSERNDGSKKSELPGQAATIGPRHRCLSGEHYSGRDDVWCGPPRCHNQGRWLVWMGQGGFGRC